jgi:hypothetical protein
MNNNASNGFIMIWNGYREQLEQINDRLAHFSHSAHVREHRIGMLVLISLGDFFTWITDL